MTFNPSQIEIIATVCFALAIIHIFSVKQFEKLSHRFPDGTPMNYFLHLMAELEIVFGIWAIVFSIVFYFTEGFNAMYQYLKDRNYTEGLFVFVVMVVSATRPVLLSFTYVVNIVADTLTKSLPFKGSVCFYFVVMAIVPILGSFITEPAAITLAALILADKVFSQEISKKLKYVTLGTLFVNVSIGGTLTNFAAPPILMVAGTWEWSNSFMFNKFGWKAIIACVLTTVVAIAMFYKELTGIAIETPKKKASYEKIPFYVTGMHFGFLAILVAVGHYPVLFLPIFIVFLGLCGKVFRQYQDRLMLEQGLLVCLFLCGLVVLGGLQQWWLQPVLMSMSNTQVMFGAIGLGAFTDNAAITYLGSLVQGLSDEFKYSLVVGAVCGGGLTVIANAPNPAAVNILKGNLENNAVEPVSLAVSALIPTGIALLCFTFLPNL